MWLIGIGGTNASGKDTLASYLVEKHGYLFVSTGEMIREEAIKRYGNVLRPTLVKVGNELRAEGGAGILIDLCIEKHKSSGNKVGLVAASIRAKGEIDEIRKQGGKLIYVDADIITRYERIKSRQREDDFISFEQFETEQQAEWKSDNPAEQGIETVKNMADYVFENNDDETEFFKQVENSIFN